MDNRGDSYLSQSWALLTRDKGWYKPVLVLAAASLVPIVGWFGVLGYALEWSRLTAWGVDSSPKQRRVNIGECLGSGFRGFVAMLGYVLVASLVNTFIENIFGENLLVSVVTYSITLTASIVGMIASLRAAIYQKVSAGYRLNRIFDMIERDSQGFMRLMLMMFVLSFGVAFVAGGLLLVTFIPMGIRLAFGLAGFDVEDMNHLDTNSMSYVMQQFFSSIGAIAPLLAVVAYITCVGLIVVELLNRTAVGLWMRQFDVPLWGASEDPLPSAMPGYGMGYGQVPYGDQTTYGQAVGDARGAYGQTPYTGQQGVQDSYAGQPPYASQTGAQDPYAAQAPYAGQTPYAGQVSYEGQTAVQDPFAQPYAPVGEPYAAQQSYQQPGTTYAGGWQETPTQVPYASPEVVPGQSLPYVEPPAAAQNVPYVAPVAQASWPAGTFGDAAPQAWPVNAMTTPPVEQETSVMPREEAYEPIQLVPVDQNVVEAIPLAPGAVEASEAPVAMDAEAQEAAEEAASEAEAMPLAAEAVEEAVEVADEAAEEAANMAVEAIPLAPADVEEAVEATNEAIEVAASELEAMAFEPEAVAEPVPEDTAVVDAVADVAQDVSEVSVLDASDVENLPEMGSEAVLEAPEAPGSASEEPSSSEDGAD